MFLLLIFVILRLSLCYFAERRSSRPLISRWRPSSSIYGVVSVHVFMLLSILKTSVWSWCEHCALTGDCSGPRYAWLLLSAELAYLWTHTFRKVSGSFCSVPIIPDKFVDLMSTPRTKNKHRSYKHRVQRRSRKTYWLAVCYTLQTDISSSQLKGGQNTSLSQYGYLLLSYRYQTTIYKST